MAEAREVYARLVDLLQRASIEVGAHPEVAGKLRGAFDPGTEIFVNQTPSGDVEASVETATALRRAGFLPVPHVAARNFAGGAALEAFLGRLSAEARVDRVLLIAGDRPEPAGPFTSVMDVLESGRVEASGIRAVGVAGHPEGNAFVDAATRDRSLVEKTTRIAAAGLDCFVVTQFCFDAAPILDFLSRAERLDIEAPIRIGIAGPARVDKLIRFGERCGVGDSLDALRARSKTVGSMIGEAGPEDLLHAVARGLNEADTRRVSGVHFYAFGGLERTSAWIETTLARLYDSLAPRATSV